MITTVPVIIKALRYCIALGLILIEGSKLHIPILIRNDDEENMEEKLDKFTAFTSLNTTKTSYSSSS